MTNVPATATPGRDTEQLMRARTLSTYVRGLLVVTGLGGMALGAYALVLNPEEADSAAYWLSGTILLLLGLVTFTSSAYVRLVPTEVNDGDKALGTPALASRILLSGVAVVALTVLAAVLLGDATKSNPDLGGIASAAVIGGAAILLGAGSVLFLTARAPRRTSDSGPDSYPLIDDPRNVTGVDSFMSALSERVSVRVRVEEGNANRWNRVNYLIGGGAALLAGVGGASGVSDLQGRARLTFGILGLIGAGLAGVATTIGASANAESATKRKVDYDDVLTQMTAAAAQAPWSNTKVNAFVQRVTAIGREGTQATPHPDPSAGADTQQPPPATT
jgi:hypothetical protein